MYKRQGFEIGAVEAKGKMNVICHSAKMECFVRPEDVERFTECLKACEAVFQNELQFSDEVEVLVEVKPEVDSCTVYTEKTASNVKNALLLLPNEMCIRDRKHTVHHIHCRRS